MNSESPNSGGECERCKREVSVLRGLICLDCFSELERIRRDPGARIVQLRKLAQTESGILRQVRNEMLLATNQAPIIRPLTLGGILKQRERKKSVQIYEREQAAALLNATKERLARARASDCVSIQLSSVNEELLRWLAKHPDAIRNLAPRKFEEVIAEILKDQGHSVEITPQTRDGGYDIIAVMKSHLGELLTIVECKRTLPPYSVGISVVERFLYTLREKKRANLGLIATTTHFSPDARKCARDYEYLLRLADFNVVKEMASNYGRWEKTDESNIWVPKYTTVDA